MSEELTEQDREFACSVLPELYPGVHGEIVIREYKDRTVTFINLIWAKREGSGQVGKYLDSLEGIIIVPSIISPRFRGMLERRGYKTYAETGMSKNL